MVEFALVLPLLMVIIFIILSTSMIYAVRIAEQKSAYDAARHVAKFHQGINADTKFSNGDGSGDLSNAPGADMDQAVNTIKDLDNPTNPNWVLDAFSQPEPCPASSRPQEIIGGDNNSVAVSLGPGDPHISVPVSDMAVEVRICYKPSNIPGWDFLASVYGARLATLEEKGISVRVMDRYSPGQPQDPPPS